MLDVELKIAKARGELDSQMEVGQKIWENYKTLTEKLERKDRTVQRQAKTILKLQNDKTELVNKIIEKHIIPVDEYLHH